MSNHNPRFPVAVVIERIPLANRWVSEQWRIVAVVPDDREASEAAVVERIDADGWHALDRRRSHHRAAIEPKPKAIF